jgi:hypothetical protein
MLQTQEPNYTPIQSKYPQSRLFLNRQNQILKIMAEKNNMKLSLELKLVLQERLVLLDRLNTEIIQNQRPSSIYKQYL